MVGTLPDAFASGYFAHPTTSRRFLCRGLAPAQEAAEQAARALARDQLDVANQLGAPLASLQHDLAAVKGFQLGAVRDADDGGLRQRFGQELHHLVLALV